ncbi:MAG: exonuclease domain-containing protein [Candidatus Aenigmarchaeota archaeon]|nr:exonuclease domain-containing protein [Candidatus Aenigmarchaeota archaeon]
MDFVTIDFETATQDRDSPCEIGLTFVKDDKIVGTKSWLIKPKCYPHFNEFNISIHGIKPKDVADKLTFNQIWKAELRALLKNQFVIAHYASFDFSVLRRTLEVYKIPFPNLQYSCSYIFSKKVWPKLLSYDLKSLCNLNKISFKHHRAGEDSLACAKLSIKAFKLADVKHIDDFPRKLGTTVGKLFAGGYKPSETRRVNPALIVGDFSKHNTDSIFYRKSIVFTGTLSSMVRKDAQQIIANIGGINSDTVSKETDFLIIGQQDFRRVGEDGMSQKQEKSQNLLEKGSSIEVMSESDFLRNI